MQEKALLRFWYCYDHDDGAVTYHHNVDKNIRPPEWLNICGIAGCDYECKGIIEINENSDIRELEPVKISYEKEGGGYKFAYYIQSIYDVNNKAILESLPIVILDWFNEKIEKG
jgi:hypothetical protein